MLNLLKLELNIFLVPINISNFNFSPYEIFQQRLVLAFR
jgi:hypothetical protein